MTLGFRGLAGFSRAIILLHVMSVGLFLWLENLVGAGRAKVASLACVAAQLAWPEWLQQAESPSLHMVSRHSVVWPGPFYVVDGSQESEKGSCKASKGLDIEVTGYHSWNILLVRTSDRSISMRRTKRLHIFSGGWWHT